VYNASASMLYCCHSTAVTPSGRCYGGIISEDDIKARGGRSNDITCA